RGHLLRARLRVRCRHGLLGVAQLLPAHVAGVRGAVRTRALVRRRPRDRELRARACDRAGAAAPARALRAPPEGGGRVGLRLLVATALTAATPVAFVQAHQAPNGSFAEPGGSAGPLLTAWAALGLRASGAPTGDALQYLVAHEDGLSQVTDLELV